MYANEKNNDSLDCPLQAILNMTLPHGVILMSVIDDVVFVGVEIGQVLPHNVESVVDERNPVGFVVGA